MKQILLSLLILSFNNPLMAQTSISLEIKAPFVSAQCKTVGVDSTSSTAFRINALTATEKAEKIELSVNESFYVCQLSSDSENKKSLAWKKVDPFSPFEVQYFNGSMKTRKVFMDSNKNSNRLEFISFDESTGDSSKSRMASAANDNFVSQLSIEKSKLLDQNDLDSLEQNKSVIKKVIVFNIFNATNTVDNKEIETGDQFSSGQYILLTFKKVDNKITLTKISL